MPWSPSDAKHKTHKARNPRLARMWSQVANKSLHRYGDEGRAVRIANAVVARAKKGKR